MVPLGGESLRAIHCSCNPLPVVKTALANISKPMVPYPGPHEVLLPCRSVIQPQATRIGAYSVEAAAAGP